MDLEDQLASSTKFNAETEIATEMEYSPIKVRLSTRHVHDRTAVWNLFSLLINSN
jgi:hypothetical protein